MGTPSGGRLVMTVRKVASLYRLRIRRLTPCDSLYARNVAFRVGTPHGDVLIKPFRGSKSRLVSLSNRMARLKQSGYRYIPKWYQTSSGKRWIHLDGTLFYVTQWIDGQLLGQQNENLFELGKALGELHQTSCQIASKQSTAAKRSLKILREQDVHFRRVLPKIQSRDTAAGDWFRREGPSCLHLADEAWAILRQRDVANALRSELRRRTWVHGDVTRMNVIVSPNGIRLIDWDRMRRGSGLLELTKTLANTTDFRPDGMASILRGYEAKRRLTPCERKIICALFRLPREAWHIAKKAASGRSGPAISGLSNSWSVRLDAIQWLNTWAKGT